MQKVVSVRMEEQAHHDLKVIALVERRPIGAVLETWISDHMKKLKRVGNDMNLLVPEANEAKESEVSEGDVVRGENGKKNKRKKKYRR